MGQRQTKIDIAERRQQAFELRKRGMSVREIADAMGMSAMGICKMLEVVMNQIKATTTENAQEVRRMELARLDVMLAGIWDKARQGDVYCIDRVIRIMTKRAEYLGLDSAFGIDIDATGIAGAVRKLLLNNDTPPAHTDENAEPTDPPDQQV